MWSGKSLALFDNARSQLSSEIKYCIKVKLPLWQAKCSTVHSLPPRLLGSHFCSAMRYFTISTWPFKQAMWSGKSPALFGNARSQLSSEIRYCIKDKLPLLQAKWSSGHSLPQFGLATRYLTTSTHSFKQAMWSGKLPPLLCCSGSQCCSVIRYCTTGKLPPTAA